MKTGLIEEIKNRMTCPDYMEREHNITPRAGRCKSFRPDAKNPSSLMCNERDWYDFGSGLGGDIIDLCAHDKFNGNKGDAIRYLAEQCGIRNVKPEINIVFNSYSAILDEACTFYQQSMLPRHLEYLKSRGLTQQTIDQLRIGWADNPCPHLKEKGFAQDQINNTGLLSFVNRLMIPYLRNGKAVYFCGRASIWEDTPSENADAKYMKLFRSDMSEHPIWGMDTLRREGTVIIAEGIFDAISCWQENYPVVTAVTGAFSAEQKKDLLPALRGRDVLVCMDYDPETHAGQTFTAKLANELFQSGIHVQACFLNGFDKKVDLSELYAEDPCRSTLDHAFSAAENWEDHQIKEISNFLNENEKKEALAKFLRQCAKFMDRPTVMQVAENARSTEAFPKKWVDELIKTLDKAPSELEIVQEFKSKHDCIYHESLGWYSYDTTRWVTRSEYEIRQKIAELYGKFRTARNVDAVHRLLKAELIRRELFDLNKDLLNFPNGMLNVETGELLPHNRTYYSSIQMNYPYDPYAKCPNWDKFISTVTDDDLQRHDLLQEMFGYCLTKDSRYQKCFCLIGNGANGKSVLLNVLEAMLGEKNTSHIEIAFLNSDFQRIKLFNSMVNICNDMKTDVSGTESFFKAIVAGDPINGCYKGMDFVDFKPYCKMVFSANRMLTAKDVDYSYLRRFCFVEFPIKFTDTPSASNERKKDASVVMSLLEELPGIFNWAFRGLQALRKNGHFTESSDQTQMTRELVLMANPLVSFVEDVIGNGGPAWKGLHEKTEIYSKYDEWCKKSNSSPLSSRSFWPRLRSFFPYREVRTATTRYVEFTELRKFIEDEQK